MTVCDVAIVGGGIVGLTLARQLLLESPTSRVLVFEKEDNSVSHGTGRNSGVVHSGIYYEEGSLRARLAVAGAQQMIAFVRERNLWMDGCGKLLVPTREASLLTMDRLLRRGQANGVMVERVDAQQMLDLEPRVNPALGAALYVPSTAVVQPKAVAEAVLAEVRALGGTVYYNTPVIGIDARAGAVITANGRVFADQIFNCAGLHADQIARQAGLEMRFQFQPFKGKYWRHSDPEFRMRRLVYPIPDLALPFLGVHTAHTADGSVYFGPSSTPVLGREHYGGIRGLDWVEAGQLAWSLCHKIARNTNGLSDLARREAKLLTRTGVCHELSRLITDVAPQDLAPGIAKVGIRSQIFDPKARALVNDFVVLSEDRVVHVLNAISPAFTASFAFAEHLTQTFRT